MWYQNGPEQKKLEQLIREGKVTKATTRKQLAEMDELFKTFSSSSVLQSHLGKTKAAMRDVIKGLPQHCLVSVAN